MTISTELSYIDDAKCKKEQGHWYTCEIKADTKKLCQSQTEITRETKQDKLAEMKRKRDSVCVCVRERERDREVK